ncbi:MAG: hypothetical protein EOP50_22870 [Sphingobacteriales bacterium]|nr:MAG: hypothetical protein EOP50_22870 [Sphingobacteriales bacterium]
MDRAMFNMLSSGEQRSELLGSGAFLRHRKEGDLSVLLYQLHGYYVEVFYFMHNLSIQNIESFDDLERLEPYLLDINIDKLLTA